MKTYRIEKGRAIEALSTFIGALDQYSASAEFQEAVIRREERRSQAFDDLDRRIRLGRRLAHLQDAVKTAGFFSKAGAIMDLAEFRRSHPYVTPVDYPGSALEHLDSRDAREVVEEARRAAQKEIDLLHLIADSFITVTEDEAQKVVAAGSGERLAAITRTIDDPRYWWPNV